MNPPEFKEAFKKRYEELLGKEEAQITLQWLLKPLTPGIRTNTLKTSVTELENRMKNYGWKYDKIPFAPLGFWIREREIPLGNTLEHFLGYYYVQEAASMIPPLVLDPKENELILDLAASPGSKTTQMAGMMKNSGLIIANDVRIDRIKAISMNLQRIGVSNTIVTRGDGSKIGKLGAVFDKVLVDAPCSAEGAIRKNYKTITEWSLEVVKSLRSVQKKLIQAGFDSLKPGGRLVYSTCTLTPEEDESVVSYLLENNKNARLEQVNIKNLKIRPGITHFQDHEFNPEVKKTARIYPQDNDTEGFFVSLVVKE